MIDFIRRESLESLDNHFVLVRFIQITHQCKSKFISNPSLMISSNQQNDYLHSVFLSLFRSINNKQEKTSYQLKSLRKPSNISISTSSIDKKLQPLCWSDLLETNKQRDYSKHISGLYSSLSNENSRNNSMDCSFIKKKLWKPAKAIVS